LYKCCDIEDSKGIDALYDFIKEEWLWYIRKIIY
jgi:hypothetical protein